MTDKRTPGQELGALLDVYSAREDLKASFPEVMDGQIERFLEWTLSCGIVFDSAKASLAQHENYYRNIAAKPRDGVDTSVVTNYLKNAESSWIWDNSKEQYLQGDFKIYWETLGEVAHYQYECVSGDRNQNIVEYVISLAEQRAEQKGDKLNCCFLGCDEWGMPEVRFHETGIFNRIQVMDIAKGLLGKQKTKVDELGIDNIDYVWADFNQFTLEQNAYDVIYSWGTIHHVEKLDHFFSQVNNALNEDAFFTLREYAGPNRLQLTDEQLALTNAILRLIPAQYKRLPTGEVKSVEARVDADELIKIDPSESISSEYIVDKMQTHLTVKKLCNTGGTLLHPLLNGIAGNFESNEDGQKLLQALVAVDKSLVASGLLPSDYIFAVAGKKS